MLVSVMATRWQVPDLANCPAAVMDIDAVGTFTMSRAAFEALKQQGGCIINISATLHYGATWYQVTYMWWHSSSNSVLAPHHACCCFRGPASCRGHSHSSVNHDNHACLALVDAYAWYVSILMAACRYCLRPMRLLPKLPWTVSLAALLLSGGSLASE